MLTGIYAVRNMLLGANYDLWKVNADMEYHEEVREEAKAELPQEAESLWPQAALYLGRVDREAMGVAVGAVSGAILFLVTMMLIVKGGTVIGPNLSLLGQFFPGYGVTLGGSLVGLLYGAAAGFL